MYKNMKKSAMSLVLASALVLTGCSGSDKTAEADKSVNEGTEIKEANNEADEVKGENEAGAAGTEKTVLKYYTWMDEESYASQIVDIFNQQSEDIEVELNIIPSKDYPNKMLAMLTADADVDVMSINGIGQYFQYSQGNALCDLTDMISEKSVDIASYGPSFRELAIDGKYYSLPYRTMSFGLYYNKDLFDAKGIPYPENLNWEEYAEIARELTDKDAGVWGGFVSSGLNAPLMTSQMNSNFIDDDTTGIAAWLEYLNQLYSVDQSHMSFVDMKATSADGTKMFENGEVAMLLDGEWIVNMVEEAKDKGETDVNYGVATIPQLDKNGKKVTTGGVSTYVAISDKCQNKEAAFEFVQFFAGKEAAKIIAENGVLPALVDDEIKDTFLNAKAVDGAESLLEYDAAYQEDCPVANMSELKSIYSEEKELYFIGEKTIEETMDSYVKRRAEALNK